MTLPSQQTPSRGAGPRSRPGLPARRRLGRRLAGLVGALALVSSCILRMPPPAEKQVRAGPPPVATRFARLTHVEWAQSVRELFQIDAAELGESLRADPRQQGFFFDNYSASLVVDDALWRGYQAAAAEVARLATEDAARVEVLVAGDAPRALVERLGARVHRRPLTPEQVDQYLAVYEAGESAYGDCAGRACSVRLLVEALLQSPHFLYRTAGGGGVVDGAIRLDAYELAARLSYALEDAPPDEQLMALAGSGELLEAGALGEQGRRLLAGERAREVISRFHAQLFELERLRAMEASPEVFVGLSPSFAESAARERELFVQYQVFERDGGFTELLASPETFVDAELARIYGVEGSFGEEFSKVSLDARERRGLLTQVAFLASHATSTDPDPIHRGVFVARRLLCKPLVAPNEVPPLPEPKGQTNRQLVESHTEAKGTACAACHARTINPLGFPFEVYDAIGRRRSQDRGHPVDARAEPVLDRDPVPVADGVELSLRIAESRRAHECYARKWLEYVYSRPTTPRDSALVSELGERSLAGELSVKELVLALVEAPAFRAIDVRDASSRGER